MKSLYILLATCFVMLSIPSHAQHKSTKKKPVAKSKKTVSKSTVMPKVDYNKPLVWYTDLAEAQKLSNASKKPIFGFFTGSDWCGWCRKLQNDVFIKNSFIQWANKNVILLELDFPRSKQLSPELKKQNGDLQEVFHVAGYPTIWMFFLTDDAATQKKNISSLGSLGYPSGAEPGKEDLLFLKNADAILKNQTK